MNISKKNIDKIRELCKLYKVKRFSVLGSVLKDNFTPQSDIDFAVDFEENDPFTYADLYFELKEQLENLFNRDIDLIEERAIKNPYFRKELEETSYLIYG